MSMDRVPCVHCGGTRPAVLPMHLANVLGYLRSQLGDCDVISVFDHLNKIEVGIIGIMAVNNRLEAHRAWGPVTRRKAGRFWLYKPMPFKEAARFGCTSRCRSRRRRDD